MDLNAFISELPGETQICRCEEIVASDIRRAVIEGATTINDVKRRTRAGMGVCQGIFCTRTIAAMIHADTGEPLKNIVPMTARPPARLIPLAQLAEPEE